MGEANGTICFLHHIVSKLRLIVSIKGACGGKIRVIWGLMFKSFFGFTRRFALPFFMGVAIGERFRVDMFCYRFPIITMRGNGQQFIPSRGCFHCHGGNILQCLIMNGYFFILWVGRGRPIRGRHQRKCIGVLRGLYNERYTSYNDGNGRRAIFCGLVCCFSTTTTCFPTIVRRHSIRVQCMGYFRLSLHWFFEGDLTCTGYVIGPCNEVGVLVTLGISL